MKKISTIFLITVFITGSVHAQVVFGPELGISNCSMKIIAPTPFRTLSSGNITGAKIGGTMDVNISPHLYFQTGLFFNIKGNAKSFKASINDTLVEYVDQTLQINYLELPINVIFKTNMQGQGRIFFGLGASINLVAGGRDMLHVYGHSNASVYDHTSNTRIMGGSDVSRADAGLNIMTGYEFHSGLFLRAFYYYGFTDISTMGDESDKNRSYGISLGYLFGNSKRTNPVNELMAE